MLSLDDMMNMTPEEFSENWKNDKIQDSALKLLGAREMTDEEKQELENKK